MQLSWACEEQLFRQEMENADDIRLSVRLYSKCLPDKRKVCCMQCHGPMWCGQPRHRCLAGGPGSPTGPPRTYVCIVGVPLPCPCTSTF